MATNPFGGAGLGQFGQDLSYTAGGGPLSSAISGVKDVLMTKGLKASGIQDYLNGLGGNASVPPPASNSVAPMTTAVPAVPSVAPPVVDMGENAMNAIIHPEVANTLITSLF